MARRVDDVELVGAAVAGGVAQRHALRLDGDAALPLQIHRVEHLLGHFPLAQPAADLNEAIGERGLAVVDVGDDRKVANVIHELHGPLGRWARSSRYRQKGAAK